jgi:polyisoprenoid-binding protein YceI
MLKILRLFMVMGVLGASLSAWTAQYKLDASHAQIGFKVRHLGFSWVSGNFNTFSGGGEFDEKTGKIKAMNITIDAASINTNEKDRDKHLRSADFFDVTNHKTVTFEMKNLSYKGKKPSEIHGTLTLRGKSLPIKLKISEWGGTAVDAWGNHRLAFEATGEIDRTKYGLKWNKGLKKGLGLTVGNNVKLIIQAQAIKQEDAKKKTAKK